MSSTVAQTAFVVSAALFGGVAAAVGYVAAAAFGLVLLETVNYLQHYGLERGSTEHVHAWESGCAINRLMLLDLTLHADHHARPEVPYYGLREMKRGAELPYGYATLILLAWLPPLWFRMMDRRLDELRIAAS